MGDSKELTVWDVQRQLSRAHQDIGRLLVTADDLESDNLVIARSYINQAMKELLKANDGQVEKA